ncbi:MAG: DUF2163 domain-containing protein [Devosia sp.]|nr:DUF2163 domain-containing protein [Devosia sp.]
MTKTPIDNGTPGATLALLNSGVDFQMVDLWAIRLNGGTTVYWHGAGISSALTFNGATYLAGPGIDRGTISTKLGLDVATLDMNVSASASDLINGVPLIPFAQGRGFDGATVILYRGFMAAWTIPLAIVGATIAFSGRVTQLKDVSRAKFTMTVSAWTVLLNVNMGPDVFQAGCLNNLYDADCTLSAASYATAGAVVGSGATTTSCNTNLAAADGYYSQGRILWLTGANAGLQRAVKSYVNASGALSFAYPLPNPPAAGDTFTAYAGCDLTMATCTARFNNLIHFRGQPFTPAAISGAVG